MWEQDFLTDPRIGAPVSPDNVLVCDLWAASEGVLDRNNPFAVSGQYPGATLCIAQCGTSSPVFAYDTIEAGVAATVAFLGGSNYVDIVDAFRADAGPQALYDAINASPWCAGCQNGHYPVQLYQWLLAHPPTPSPAPTERSDMPAIVLPNGTIKLYAIGAGARGGQLLEFTSPSAGGAWSVADITDGIANVDPNDPNGPYTVSQI